MTLAQVLDEDEIKLLLLGDAEEVRRGMSLVHEHYMRRTCGRLRRNLPWLPSQDLPDIWHETLVALLENVRSGQFEADRSLGSLLFTIARNKVVDRVRRKTTREDALHAIGHMLKGSNIGSQWRTMKDVERNEILDLMEEMILKLPDRQSLVLWVFANGLPETRSMEKLRIAVSQMTGQEETMASVKRALQEARGKARAFLRIKGYDLND